MIKFIIFYIVLNINLSTSDNCECGVIMNRKYVYSRNNISFSITFDSDSTYILMSENLTNRGGTKGIWQKDKKNNIFFTPSDTKGIIIPSNTDGRIKTIDFYSFFDLKNAKGRVNCKKRKSYILIENYTFSIANQ